MIKRDLRQVARSDLAGLSQYGSSPLRDVVTLHPFELTPESGETLPRPDRDAADGGTVLVGPADAFYLLAHSAPVTLGAPAMEDGAYAGQRIRLSARTADITLPAGPSLRGGPLTVVPGQDVELVWDPDGQWTPTGVSAGGPPAVFSVFGRLGAVVAQAGDYTPVQVGADPAGTATAEVAGHVAQPDPHTQYLLKSGGTMSGTLVMAGQAISNAGTVTATSYNAVPLTALGLADTWLNGAGAYSTPSAADVGADPAGSAAAAVAGHVGLADPHTQYLLKAGGTMAGTLAMGGQAISGAGAVTGSSFNGVVLTTGGPAGQYLTAAGTYAVALPDLNFSSRTTPLATTSPTPVSYLLHTTPALVAGFHYILISVITTGSAANTQIAIDLSVDGTPIPSPLQETGIAGGRLAFAGILPWPMSPGVHTVELFVSLGGGSGTVTALGSSLTVWRAT